LQAENESIINEICIYFLVPQKLQSTLTFNLRVERHSGLKEKGGEERQIFPWQHPGQKKKKSFILKLSTGIFRRN